VTNGDSCQPLRIERYGNGIDLNVSIVVWSLLQKGDHSFWIWTAHRAVLAFSRSKPEYAEQVHKQRRTNSYLTNLSAPANGFANWRAMCLSAPNASPAHFYAAPTGGNSNVKCAKCTHKWAKSLFECGQPIQMWTCCLIFSADLAAARDILVNRRFLRMSAVVPTAAARDFEVVRNSIRKRLSRGFFPEPKHSMCRN